MDSLKKIINDIFFVDINKRTRKRELVDARRAYSKILRDVGFSYQHIGDSIGKDHATVIHYIKTIDPLLKYDPVFQKKFLLTKKQFKLENKELILRSNLDIYTTASNLRDKLDEVILEKKQILIKFVDYLEQFEKTTGYLPNVYDIRRNILPLFD
jgi:hypothetical protein